MVPSADEEGDFWDVNWRACERVLELVHIDETVMPVRKSVILHLMSRLLDTASAISVLADYESVRGKSFVLDAGTLVRVAYDTHLQLLWVMHSEDRIDARCDDFDQFQWIENLRQRFILEQCTQPFFERTKARIHARPEHLDARRAQDEHIRKVGPRFLQSSGKKQLSRLGAAYLLTPDADYRKHWYEGSLKQIADACGYLEEFRLVVEGGGHGSTHSSPMALLGAPMMNMKSFRVVSSRLACRCAHRIVRVLSLAMDDALAEKVLSLAERPITEWIPERNVGPR